jgi:AraC-like DNA-binding protein
MGLSIHRVNWFKAKCSFSPDGGSRSRLRMHSLVVIQSMPKFIVFIIPNNNPFIPTEAILFPSHLASSSVMAKLSELLFVEAVRAYSESQMVHEKHWLHGLKDKHVGRALAALHDRLAHGWSVVELAAEAGLSRSAFVERFTAAMGAPPTAGQGASGGAAKIHQPGRRRCWLRRGSRLQPRLQARVRRTPCPLARPAGGGRRAVSISASAPRRTKRRGLSPASGRGSPCHSARPSPRLSQGQARKALAVRCPQPVCSSRGRTRRSPCRRSS